MKKTLTKEEVEGRKARVIARGEFSDHCHVIEGNATIVKKGNVTYVNVEDSTAVMKHLIESEYLKGNDVWTKEHHDAPITDDIVRHGDVTLVKQTSGPNKGMYQFVVPQERDLFSGVQRRVRD
jgi:hypothetical protein